MPKTGDASFDEIKRRVTARLMPLEFVSGIGGAGNLNVMLSRPISRAEQDHVRSVMQEEAEGYDYTLEKTGKFSKR